MKPQDFIPFTFGEDKWNRAADLLNAILYGWKHNEYS